MVTKNRALSSQLSTHVYGFVVALAPSIASIDFAIVVFDCDITNLVFLNRANRIPIEPNDSQITFRVAIGTNANHIIFSIGPTVFSSKWLEMMGF